jgi:hypothetical protein
VSGERVKACGVVLGAGGKQQQFAWDGNKVIAINKDLLDEGYTAAGGQARLVRQLHAAREIHPLVAGRHLRQCQ